MQSLDFSFLSKGTTFMCLVSNVWCLLLNCQCCWITPKFLLIYQIHSFFFCDQNHQISTLWWRFKEFPKSFKLYGFLVILSVVGEFLGVNISRKKMGCVSSCFRVEDYEDYTNPSSSINRNSPCPRCLVNSLLNLVMFLFFFTTTSF